MDFKNVLLLLFLGIVIGAGLTYGFRGWIERAKRKALVFILNDLATVRAGLAAALVLVKAEDKEVKDAITRALQYLNRHL